MGSIGLLPTCWSASTSPTALVMLVANHNLETLLTSIQTAHRLHDLEASDAEKFCPVDLIRAREAIEEVFESETPLDVIADNRKTLGSFSSQKGDHEEEQSR